MPFLIPRYQDAELEFIPEMLSRGLSLTVSPGQSVTLPCEVMVCC